MAIQHPGSNPSDRVTGIFLPLVVMVEPLEPLLELATHQGTEIDLVLFKHGRRIGVERKRMDAPTLTPSMRIALNDLKLNRLVVVYPGERRYALADRVEVIPLFELVGAKGEAARIFKRRCR